MKGLTCATLLALSAILLSAGPLPGADDSKVKAATQRVQKGGEKIGEGKISEGVEETAKGIADTVVEGAKVAGEKLKESAKAAEPRAKTTWEKVREGATAFGQSVKTFFTRLAGK